MFQGALFTGDWLKEDIAEAAEWGGLSDDTVGQQLDSARALLVDHARRE